VNDGHFTDDTMAVDLIDRRTIVVPLPWYPKLLDATPPSANCQLSDACYAIHWPDLDEDLSPEGMLREAPVAPEPVRAQM
jgi:hypothetical protein